MGRTQSFFELSICLEGEFISIQQSVHFRPWQFLRCPFPWGATAHPLFPECVQGEGTWMARQAELQTNADDARRRSQRGSAHLPPRREGSGPEPMEGFGPASFGGVWGRTERLGRTGLGSGGRQAACLVGGVTRILAMHCEIHPETVRQWIQAKAESFPGVCWCQQATLGRPLWHLDGST